MTEKEQKTKKTKTPWPTKDAMEQVYKMKLWGGNGTAFYSGDGSHDLELVDPYIAILTSFLTSFEEPLTVCDLGCGDFNVGKDLVKYAKKYIAVDIVEDLINFNRKKFTKDNVAFHCLDIVKDDLPVADCAIVRQVLQHLSNAEVQRVVTKLAAYKYIVLTEHLPEGAFVANADIISGQGIRLKKHSGLKLTAPPFNFSVKDEKELLTLSSEDYKGVIVTTLYRVL